MKTTTMTVGTRLRIGFGVVLMLMAIMIVLALLRFSAIGDINDKIIAKDWVNADAANTVNVMTRANARRTMELLIATDPAQRATIYDFIEANKKAINVAFDILERHVDQRDGQALLARIKAARGVYVGSYTTVSKLVEEGKKDEAIAVMTRHTLPALDALQKPISELTELQRQVVVASSAEMKQGIHWASVSMMLLGALSLAVGFVAAWLITRALQRQLGGEPAYAVGITGSIAAGDLTVAIDTDRHNETSLLFAMQVMRDSLVHIVGQVRSGTDTIATAASQIASGNLDLSSRTEEQASALEETASAMEQLTSTVKQNADNAHQANVLAQNASTVAVRSGAVVSQVVETMGSINQSSKKIVDIIGVIDDIAFQTNILALNAAVEAARAGEQGRGFAVVATEVRNLAQRSAAAAKEIKHLIRNSVEQVEIGTKLVDQAGATMQEVVDSVNRVTDIIGDITTASREQSSGIEQINQAIMQLDDTTQQNAALVEEAAAAAHSMQEQSEHLSRVMSVFKLAQHAHPAPPVSIVPVARPPGASGVTARATRLMVTNS